VASTAISIRRPSAAEAPAGRRGELSTCGNTIAHREQREREQREPADQGDADTAADARKHVTRAGCAEEGARGRHNGTRLAL
jgi:hypothetical protein